LRYQATKCQHRGPFPKNADCIGLTSINDGNNVFPYSSMAYVDSTASLIDINIFRRILRQNAEFANSIINILCENSQQTFGRFFCLTHKHSYGRLADILLCLSDRVFKSDAFELPLSRKDLAELSGLSSENVIRLLKTLKEDGLIEMNGKNFRLLDHDRLRQISDNG